MKKLLLISSYSVHLVKYLELVESYFDEIQIVTSAPLKDCQWKVEIVDFGLKWSAAQTTISILKKMYREFQPSIVHVHQANSVAFYSFLAMRGTHVPKVLTAWGSDVLVLPKKNWMFRWMVQFNLRNADYITSDSTYMGQEIARLAALKNNILYVNFGVATSLEYDDKENLVYSNRLHKPLYRIDDILTAFHKFHSKNPDWKLIVAATGSETERLEKWVTQNQLTQAIQFVGWLSSEENEAWYKRAKVYVSIPESDGTSISLLEAMGCGCLPVVSDLPANREWIDSGVNGYLVSDTKSDFLNEVDLSLWESASELNRALVQRKGTKSANRALFIELYDRLLKSQNP